MNPVLLIFESSELTNDFDISDINVLNGTIGEFTGSNAIYNATFIPNGPGYCSINVSANTFSDLNGNLNVAASNIFTFNYDNVSPTMFISSSDIDNNSTTNMPSVALSFQASKDTSDFVKNNITITNGTLSNFSGSGFTYSATFTASGNGDCTIFVNSGVFQDDAGNTNIP